MIFFQYCNTERTRTSAFTRCYYANNRRTLLEAFVEKRRRRGLRHYTKVSLYRMYHIPFRLYASSNERFVKYYSTKYYSLWHLEGWRRRALVDYKISRCHRSVETAVKSARESRPSHPLASRRRLIFWLAGYRSPRSTGALMKSTDLHHVDGQRA